MKFFVGREHSQLYDVWRSQKMNNLAVCHVDFHCDMRGLLIDRWLSKARYVWQFDPYIRRLDSGSFLTHAVMQGIVTQLRWVHDRVGGRTYDPYYCVKYDTDLTALLYRVSKRSRWVPLAFEETTFENQAWLIDGEHLCIDWDGIAFRDYDEDKVRQLMTTVLAMEAAPASLFLAHSPDYCHANPRLFDEFVAALEEKYHIHSIRLPDQDHPPISASLPWRIYHNLEFLLLRQMRKRGFY